MMNYYHPFSDDRGLTLRDYFASQLYQSGSDNLEQAKAAFRAADAMLVVREMTDEELNPLVVELTTVPIVQPVVETPVVDTPTE